MCEQFKIDFVKKIGKLLEDDAIPQLKAHYDIEIKPCAFRNEVKEDCKQFYINLPNVFRRGIKCKTCEKSVCNSCSFKKALEISRPLEVSGQYQCINCYIKTHPDQIKPISCCYCRGDLDIFEKEDELFFCKVCNLIVEKSELFT